MMRSSLASRSRRAAVSLLLFAGVPGCTDDYGVPAPDGSYTVWQDDVMIGIVAVDEELTAYVCDGRPEGVTITEWFHGTVDRGLGTLTNTNGDALLFDHTDEGTRVVLQLKGKPEQEFGATHESDPKRGVYWGEQGDWLGGWVFATADDQRGAVFKRNTGDAAFVGLTSPSATSVTLPDGQTMTVQKLTTPKVLGQY